MTINLYTYKFEYLSAYDGDTVTGNIKLPFNLSKNKASIRLYGINTPELRDSSKEEGIKVRDYVRSCLSNSKETFLFSIKDKSEKYGRILGIIFYTNKEGELVNLNEELVLLNMAELYLIKTIEELRVEI